MGVARKENFTLQTGIPGCHPVETCFLLHAVSDSSFQDFCNKIDILFTPCCRKKGLVSSEHLSLELKFLSDL